jgi:hypothetical protein
MMYGDRDYACNWVGGEAASLAVPYSRQAEFAAAGYSPFLSEDGASGFTRQLGNFSFTRVFQSGHEVPSYQPAAALAIFNRATFNLDVALGLRPVTDDLATRGPRSTFGVKNTVPDRPAPRCNVLKPNSCEPDVLDKVTRGKVVVKDFFVVEVLDDDEEDASPALPLVVGQEKQGVIGEL